jgi:uncharacterized protein (TIGR03435 family)
MSARKTLLLLVAAVLTQAAIAQQAGVPAVAAASKVPAFEVATIKPTARTDGSWRLQPTPDGYTGMDISLRTLVGEAYGIYDIARITGGPSWVDRDKFDLEAKFDPAEIPGASHLTFRQRADMLRPLLAERFGLKVHWETKEFPVYDLVIAKGGSKLLAPMPEDILHRGAATCLFGASRKGYIRVQGCVPKDLEDQLRFATGRTVIDKTGITTRSNFELRWTPDDTPADPPEDSGPSIFTAVQEQPGLKLAPAVAPLDILVIDAAAKPSEN